MASDSCRLLQECFQCIEKGCSWIALTSSPCRSDGSDLEGFSPISTCPSLPIISTDSNMTSTNNGTTTDRDALPGHKDLYDAFIALLIIAAALIVVTTLSKLAHRKRILPVRRRGLGASDLDAVPGTSSGSDEHISKPGEYERFV